MAKAVTKIRKDIDFEDPVAYMEAVLDDLKNGRIYRLTGKHVDSEKNLPYDKE